MTHLDLVLALRSTWNALTPQQQQELHDTVLALRRDSALKAAAGYQDPMCRFFAEQLAPADSPTRPTGLTRPTPPAIDV